MTSLVVREYIEYTEHHFVAVEHELVVLQLFLMQLPFPGLIVSSLLPKQRERDADIRCVNCSWRKNKLD